MWIKTSEKLPEWYKWVWVYAPAFESIFNGILISRRVEKGDGNDGWFWDFSNYKSLVDTSITHWMPLPSPPTAGEEEYVTCFMCGSKVKRDSDIWYPVPLASGKVGYLCETCSTQKIDHGLQGAQDIPCLKVPQPVAGSTGIGPEAWYYNEENVKEMSKLINSGFTITDCLENIIAQMKKTNNECYEKESIPEWLRYLAWLYEKAKRKEAL